MYLLCFFGQGMFRSVFENDNDQLGASLLAQCLCSLSVLHIAIMVSENDEDLNKVIAK